MFLACFVNDQGCAAWGLVLRDREHGDLAADIKAPLWLTLCFPASGFYINEGA